MSATSVLAAIGAVAALAAVGISVDSATIRAREIKRLTRRLAQLGPIETQWAVRFPDQELTDGLGEPYITRHIVDCTDEDDARELAARAPETRTPVRRAIGNWVPAADRQETDR